MRVYRLRVPVAEGRHAVDVAGADHHYLARVLRLHVGDDFDAVDVEGRMCRARVVRVTQGALTLEVWPLVGGAPQDLPFRIHLFPCLPKGQKMDIIVRQATEAGVATITAVRSERAIGEASTVRLDRWRRISVEALQQSGRRTPPQVVPPVDLSALVRCVPAEGARDIVFHEDPVGSEPLHRILCGPVTEVRVLLGPEGGLSPGELGLLRAAGWRQGYLGPNVLRVETAATAAVASLTIVLMEKDTWRAAPKDASESSTSRLTP
jgi:16S rRNA (uracil1498-N3)-methyltransferase